MSSSSPHSPTAATRRASATHHYTDSPEQTSSIPPADSQQNEETTYPMPSHMETEHAVPRHKSMSGIESTIRFLLLPSQIFIVLTLEFLNSFRSFGLRFVLYNYITNEFGIGDAHAGVLLGIKGFVDIGFGLAGSILVDIVGVRRISLVALSVALVGRTLLAFGRSKVTLYPALFLFSPCGDALLSTGLYAVALKKLTTPLTRPLAFAISYATFNLAGAAADLILDKMRASVEDYSGVGGVYTPVRQFIVITWGVLIVTFLIAFCFLRDLSVIDPADLDLDQTPQPDAECTEEDNGIFNVMPINAVPVKPMVELCTLKRWFPNQQMFYSDDNEAADQSRGNNGNSQSTASAKKLPNYKMYKTKYSNNAMSSVSLKNMISNFFLQVMSILRLRNTWIVLVFGFLTMAVGMNWSASEMVLPPFLERRFGETIPIYTIQSINMIMCLIFPPFLASLTGYWEAFQVIMPGLWLMAISPIFVAFSPNVLGACLWQVVMTFGEVLWSPRLVSWTANLAPVGKEGLFFAVSSARALLGPLADFILGVMNDRFNPNCTDCRDQYGHFCDTSNGSDTLQCASVEEECELFLDTKEQLCPSTCLECPTWKPTNPSTLWYLLTLASIASPLSVWFCLPFLRGRHKREDRCYGLFYMGKNRLRGFCGAPGNDNAGSYRHVNEEGGSFCNSELDTAVLSHEAEML